MTALGSLVYSGALLLFGVALGVGVAVRVTWRVVTALALKGAEHEKSLTAYADVIRNGLTVGRDMQARLQKLEEKLQNAPIVHIVHALESDGIEWPPSVTTGRKPS